MPSRSVPFVFAAFAVFLGAACAACASGQAIGDPIERFREDLADPARFPVRDGLMIDTELLKDAIRGFADEHRALLRERLAASEAALVPGAQPAEPAYERLGAASDAAVVDFGPMVALLEVLDPDIPGVVRRTLSVAVPSILIEELSAPPDVIGLWLGYLSTARPTWRACGRTERRLTVCADYGGLDVFVVELVRSESLWTPAAVAWWQRRR